MMLGEPRRPNPTINIPPCPQLHEDPTADNILPPHSLNGNANGSPENYNLYHLQEAFAALNSYLPSNDAEIDSDSDILGMDPDSPVDAYSCDHFRLYEFKVRKCARGRSHDWTECPYTHPGEKARRRDPRKYLYSGTACLDFRKGSCKKGDTCEFAHGVFECWLHPARYRTQPCKDGAGCKRRVCFFAHSPDQLRILPQQSPRSGDSPPRTKTLNFMPSPESISPPMSPRTELPMSNSLSPSVGMSSITDIMASLRNLQLGKVSPFPSSYKTQVCMGSLPGYGSQRRSMLRPGFCSLPSTPTRTPTRPGVGFSDLFDTCWEEDPVMKRVESGRDLRAKMFEKLSKKNSLNPTNEVTPDVGWVSELVNEEAM